MKLAILCGANPRAHKVENGATIRLQAGNWKLVTEGLVDSDLALSRRSSESTQPIKDGDSFQVGPEGDAASLSFTKRGNEDYISAYLLLLPV